MNEQKRQGYVYVLHFDEPISTEHTCQHYIGCTCDLRQRLITHAQGRGARLTEVAKERGIGWQLAALGVTHVAGMRRIERQLKQWHGVAGQCTICTVEPRAIPGTKAYPLEEIPFPVRSEQLRQLGTTEPTVTFRFTNGDDSLRVINDLMRLMKLEKDALGFIPLGKGLTISAVNGQIAVCYVDGVMVGYCQYSMNAEMATIHQCVVADSQRRCGIGRRLVEMCVLAHPDRDWQAHVRDDLQANAFWRGIGFNQVGWKTHETSGQQLNHYVCKKHS